MKFSIRTRFAFLMSLVYLTVFFFLMTAGALALYLGLREQIDHELTNEKKWAIQLFENEFFDLKDLTGDTRKELAREFSEELDEVYLHKKQFVIFSVESDSARDIYCVNNIGNVLLLLPKGFLSRRNGFYNLTLNHRRYRLLLTKTSWGTFVVGAENQTFFEVTDEFKELLVIGVPLTFLLVLGVGRFLAKFAMKPVLQAAEATREITLTNLEKRLPAYSGHDEFGKLVETLNQMISRLDEGVKRVQQFTQDAAHELRTPLTILRGELELLYQKPDTPENVRASLQKALDRTIRLGKIVNDLGLLAQTDAGKYPIQKTQFDLSAVLQELAEDTRMLVEGRPIQVNFQENTAVKFWGDEQLIRRLLLNLADNAVKFTPEGTINFSLSKDAKQIRLSISDSGIGIPPEELSHIFNRFYRIDKARSGAGSGLGLAICKWIVTVHAGTITANSQPNRGTTIEILLPANK
jgi:heavy metal sensor kinase